jgi:dipeptidyl-peptidase-4
MMPIRRLGSHGMHKNNALVPVLALVFFSCAAAMTGSAGELTIDRLFDSPALSGPAITGLRVSPDNALITFLQGKSEDKNRFDLWEYDIGARRSQLLIDANTLSAPGQVVSTEEMSRRERQRTAALSGIQDYFFVAEGKSLVLAVDGQLFYVDSPGPAQPSFQQLTAGESPVTDASVSARGNFLAYVRNQNLHLFDLRLRTEKALTLDGAGAISNGVAEFVAQEEMGRHTGYWWSPDERHIAFERSDESAVHQQTRLEGSGMSQRLVQQRYPSAGEPNALVTLGVIDIASGALTWIDLGTDPDIYLARVQWLPDGKTLAIQREDRTQRRLDLLFADIGTGKSHVVLTETRSSWIDLNDELTFIRKTGEFIWGSNRDGYEHLYLYTADGRVERQLTAGGWNVTDFRERAIRGVDEKRRLVYFLANKRSPMHLDLYVTSLDTRHPEKVQRISHEAGIHGVAMAHDHSFYVDNFTSHTQPHQLSVHNSDGSLRAYVQQNVLDAQHPDAPYVADNSVQEFGSLRAADGQALFYQLFRPKNFNPAKRYPAIVTVYGGPGHQGVLDQWAGDSFTQILTRAGFVVFQLDNRGTAFRGAAFQALLSGQLGGVEIADQIQGARWLGSQSFVDPLRIGVWGWSYGGYMTLMLMFRAPEIFRAGVAGSPVTDWTLYDTHYTERFLGRPQDNPAAYEASSVLGYAGNLQGKLLVMHGMADDNVLFLNSTTLFSRLQDLGKAFDIMVYPGTKHGLLRQHEGRHAYTTILRFFIENLQQ